MKFSTLQAATREWRLRNPQITNKELAELLGVEEGGNDSTGIPGCIFTSFDGHPIVIRLTDDTVAIFHAYERLTPNMQEIADIVE